MAFFQLKVEKDPQRSYVEQLHDQLVQGFESSAIMLGTRLPSIRDLSAHLGINKQNIVECYERLLAEGYIVSRPGSGYFSSFQPASEKINYEYACTNKNTAFLLGKSALNNEPEFLKHNSSFLWEQTKKIKIAQDLIKQVLRLNINCYFDQNTKESTYTQLAKATLKELSLRFPLENQRSNIVIAGCFENLLMRLIRTLALQKSLKKIFIPCFFSFKTTSLFHHNLDFDNIQIKYYDPYLPMVSWKDFFENNRNDSEKCVTAIIVEPLAQRPTGRTASLQERTALLAAAQQEDIYLIECDRYTGTHFSQTVVPPLYALTTYEKCCYIASFSEFLHNDLSLSSMIFSKEFLNIPDKETRNHFSIWEDIRPQQSVSQFWTAFFERGSYRRMLGELQSLCSQKRDTAIGMLRRLGLLENICTAPLAGPSLFLSTERSFSDLINLVHGNPALLVYRRPDAFSEEREVCYLEYCYLGMEPSRDFKDFSLIFNRAETGLSSH